MTATMTWLLALGTVGLLVGYELALALAQWRSPGRMARSAHASLREDWLDALAHQKGSEILAVQTLRNSMMSATMTASTAVLGLMGTVTLAAPSLQASFGESAHPIFTPRLALELALLALLFASLVSSAMALRYYNHAGFISGMPVDSEARRKWAAAGKVYVRRAGILYSWGLRQLILVGPLLASILYPAAGPVAALLVIAVLFGFDRVASQ
jgi:Protein of unknown function, DUF599